MFNIGNQYGDLKIKEEDGKYFWIITDIYDTNWEEIPKSLYDELVKHQNK